MNALTTNTALYTIVSQILRNLGIPVHRIGFKCLCLAILCYSENEIQVFSKSLYPLIAQHFNLSSGKAVERAIRAVIDYGWEHGDPVVWQKYFPSADKAPSNVVFIATIAEFLK